MQDEVETIRLVQKLSLSDCRRLLPLISHMPAGSACQAVADYIAVFTPQ